MKIRFLLKFQTKVQKTRRQNMKILFKKEKTNTKDISQGSNQAVIGTSLQKSATSRRREVLRAKLNTRDLSPPPGGAFLKQCSDSHSLKPPFVLLCRKNGATFLKQNF